MKKVIVIALSLAAFFSSVATLKASSTQLQSEVQEDHLQKAIERLCTNTDLSIEDREKCSTIEASLIKFHEMQQLGKIPTVFFDNDLNEHRSILTDFINSHSKKYAFHDPIWIRQALYEKTMLQREQAERALAASNATIKSQQTELENLRKQLASKIQSTSSTQ